LPDRVVFHSSFWEKSPDAVLPSCTEQEIVAFDLLTGVLEWRYPLSQDYSRGYNGLYAVSDGVVIVLDGILIKFDSDGQYVWSDEGFPSRSINIVYQDQNNLFLPSKAKFYVVSNETGQRLEEIDIANPISVLNGNIVSAIDESHLQVQPTGSQEHLEIPVSDPALIQYAWFSQFTNIAGDILFVYDIAGYGRSSIEAYSLVDGNLLWRSVGDFDDLPVISNNYVYVYENLGIKVIQASTGDQIGTIDLTANGERQLNLSPHQVYVAIYDNILIVNIRDTWDIIALQIEPET
jgi:outer membrane protein assembly factor BamB